MSLKKIMKILYDEDGLVEEPCLSCEKSYVEDIWYEMCCDKKKCVHEEEYEAVVNKAIIKKGEAIFK